MLEGIGNKGMLFLGMMSVTGVEHFTSTSWCKSHIWFTQSLLMVWTDITSCFVMTCFMSSAIKSRLFSVEGLPLFRNTATVDLMSWANMDCGGSSCIYISIRWTLWEFQHFICSPMHVSWPCWFCQLIFVSSVYSILCLKCAGSFIQAYQWFLFKPCAFTLVKCSIYCWH